MWLRCSTWCWVCHISWYWPGILDCWDIPACDSARSSSWLCAWWCVWRGRHASIPSIFIFSSPSWWEPLLHDLSNLIPLSSQTVLRRVVKPTPFILYHMCKLAFANWDSYCTLPFFLTFYHRFSTHTRFQFQSAAQLFPLGQAYASYRAAIHRIPYSCKVRSWGREINKYTALWTHA